MVDRDCKDYNEECKYFHHEPYYTPNNYDLFFDYNNIPVNIPVEKAHDLRNRLQKLMPVTKIIHLNMGSETLKEDNCDELRGTKIAKHGVSIINKSGTHSCSIKEIGNQE